MPSKSLIILTHQFPVKSGEPWLAEETKHIDSSVFTAKVFCTGNANKEIASYYSQFTLLPDTFIYKRKWSCLFNSSFLFALITEIRELIRKGSLFKTIVKSISLLMQAYAKALWFQDEYIEKGKEYVLYCYWSDELTTMACLLKTMNSNIKVVCRVHGIDVYEERTGLKHIQFRYFQLKNLTNMFSVSQAGTDYLQKRYPMFADKISTSYLGTQQTVMNPIPGKERLELITCALLRNVKRLELIVEILKHIKTPTRWTLAGDGTDFEKLKKLCKTLPPHIETALPGKLSEQEIHKLYETHPFHYYISVSATEGLPVAMMESIGYGVPIVATNVGGCKEIVNDITGVLIPKDFDPKEVARLLDELYLNYDYSMKRRNAIVGEWDKKFNAAKNYTTFYQIFAEKKTELAFIIQARMGSTRLPNKVLLPFYKEQTILDIQLDMLKKNFSQYPIVLATSTNKADDILVEKYTSDKSIKIFRGDEHNVLKRFVDAAKTNKAFYIVRVCADNPFLSATYLDRMITEYSKAKPDYMSYRFKDGTPAIRSHSGLFAEVTTLSALTTILELAVEPIYYEHVTNYMYTHPDKFKISFLPVPEILNKHQDSMRLTIDDEADFKQVKALYASVMQKYDGHYTLENLLAEIDSNVTLQDSMRNKIQQYAK